MEDVLEVYQRPYDARFPQVCPCSVFLACEPPTGRVLRAGESPTYSDRFCALCKGLLDGPYSEAEKVLLVMGNLNTHSTGSLNEAFVPEEAAWLASRLEIHFMPKHASWLDMAEIELSILGRQCLDRLLGSLEEVQAEVSAWQHARNQVPVKIDWQFTTSDTRIKLKRLYPVVT